MYMRKKKEVQRKYIYITIWLIWSHVLTLYIIDFEQAICVGE